MLKALKRLLTRDKKRLALDALCLEPSKPVEIQMDPNLLPNTDLYSKVFALERYLKDIVVHENESQVLPEIAIEICPGVNVTLHHRGSFSNFFLTVPVQGEEEKWLLLNADEPGLWWTAVNEEMDKFFKLGQENRENEDMRVKRTKEYMSDMLRKRYNTDND